MSESFTVNGVEFPCKWYPVVDALIAGLARADRDKTTGEMTIKLVLQSGGIRDKYLTVSSKIGQ